MKRCHSARVTLLLLLSMTHAAAAQPAAQAVQAEAREHFARALELTRAGDLDGAVLAFESAYRAAPHYSVLYNLAQAHVGLGRPVEAVQTLERYLAEGGDRIEPERRQRVAELLAAQRRRIGFLSVDTEPEGAEIVIDGRPMGRTPLPAPIALAAGRHGVLVVATDRMPRAESVLISAGTSTPLHARLEPVPASPPLGSLRVDCAVPAVAIEIDGEIIASTTDSDVLLVPAGFRSVELSRVGYVSVRRKVLVPERGVAEIRCELATDATKAASFGSVSVDAPVGNLSIQLDGISYAGERVPPGPHRLRVSRSGYEPWERAIQVPPGRTARVPVALELTPESLAARRDEEQRRLFWSIGVGAAGLALVGASVATYALNGGRMDDWRQDRFALNQQLLREPSPALLRRNDELWEEARRIERTDDIAIGLGIGGLVTLAVSGVLWWTGADEPLTW